MTKQYTDEKLILNDSTYSDFERALRLVRQRKVQTKKPITKSQKNIVYYNCKSTGLVKSINRKKFKSEADLKRFLRAHE